MKNSVIYVLTFIITTAQYTLNAQAVVEDHLGQIIVWRTGEFNHPNLRNRVVLNEVPVANLSRKNYIQMIVPPGKYVLEVGDVEFISKSGEISDPNGKWNHPDEGGRYEFEVKPGMVYNIEGIMHRTDPEADSTDIEEEKLRYYIELKRYRGSYGHLQRELKARKINSNAAYVYSRVLITTSYGKKINACLIKNTKALVEYIELETLISQVQQLEKSKVKSIALLH